MPSKVCPHPPSVAVTLPHVKVLEIRQNYPIYMKLFTNHWLQLHKMSLYTGTIQERRLTGNSIWKMIGHESQTKGVNKILIAFVVCCCCASLFNTSTSPHIYPHYLVSCFDIFIAINWFVAWTSSHDIVRWRHHCNINRNN